MEVPDVNKHHRTSQSWKELIMLYLNHASLNIFFRHPCTSYSFCSCDCFLLFCIWIIPSRIRLEVRPWGAQRHFILAARWVVHEAAASASLAGGGGWLKTETGRWSQDLHFNRIPGWLLSTFMVGSADLTSSRVFSSKDALHSPLDWH